MLFPGCVGEIVYTGPDQGGHYYIKYGGGYHDGTGSRRSADARSQVAVYNVDGLPEPLFVRQGVRFYKADFTVMLKFKPACVVNAANSNLSHGGGIARAINQATNGELQKLSDRCRNKPKVGSCTVVKCRNFEVLNAVGPRDTDINVDGLLRSAYDSVRKQGHGLVVTPLLSVGIFNVPIATSLAQFLDAFDGFTNFYCYVYTDAEAAALYQYFKNLNSLTFEAAVSSGDVEPTQITEDVTVTFGTTGTSSIEEVLAARTNTESDDSDDEVVTVLVTEDTVNYTTTSVSTSATFGEQLGVCAIADTDVTTQKPTLENDGCAVVLSPVIDYASYYGFDAASFCAVSHNDYNFGCVIDDGGCSKSGS